MNSVLSKLQKVPGISYYMYMNEQNWRSLKTDVFFFHIGRSKQVKYKITRSSQKLNVDFVKRDFGRFNTQDT